MACDIQSRHLGFVRDDIIPEHDSSRRAIAWRPTTSRIESCRRRRAPSLLVLLLLLSPILWPTGTSTAGDANEHANWPRWRGPRDNGSVEGGSYPVEFKDNVLWKAPLPGKGCSTPIVWNRRIYVTAPADGKDALLALDWSGKPLWTTRFGDEDAGKHRNGSGSNPSPTTDGEAVYVYFKSGTLAAVEFDGTVRWRTNLVERYGRDTLFWDQGTSPVLTERDVIVARMHNGESWLAAFDKRSGELRWKVARNYRTPVEGDHGYTTPLVVRHDGKEALLVWGAQHVTVHDASDGRVLWSCGGFNPEGNGLWPAIATPVIAGDLAVVSFGRNDKGEPRLHGIRLGGDGDVTETHRVWKRTDVGTFVPSPVEYQGRVYVLRDRGQVECIDPETGNTLWKDAFPRSSDAYYASPLIAGGHLYAIREDGKVFVADINDGFRAVAENDMEESIIASPVPIGGRLLLRGERHLFCVADRSRGTDPVSSEQ